MDDARYTTDNRSFCSKLAVGLMLSIRNKQDKKLPLVSRDQVAYSHLKKKKT